MTEQVKLLRKSDYKLTSTSAACWSDFATILTSSNELFVYVWRHMTSDRTKGAQLISTGVSGKGVSMGLEVAARQNQAHAKLETWVQTHFLSKSEKTQKHGGAEAVQESVYHTCKYRDCSEASGVDILGDSTKYVSVRCSGGCATVYHTACWHRIETDFVENEEKGIACTREDERQCGGGIIKAVLKQNGKVLSVLLGEEAHEASAEEADEMLDDVDDDEDQQSPSDDASNAPPLHGSSSMNIAAVKGAAEGLGEVFGRRFRNQKGAAFWRSQPKARLRRVELLPNGTTAFSDEIERLEDSAHRAEKRRAQEERARERKEQEEKREEERKKKEEERASAVPAATTPSSQKKKPMTFEVVVPMTKEAVKASLPSSKPLVPPVKVKPLVPASPPESAWNVVGAARVIRSAASAPSPELPSQGFPSFISVKTATSKKIKPAMSQEDRQVAAALAASMAAAQPTKEEIEARRREKKAAKQSAKEERQRLAALEQTENEDSGSSSSAAKPEPEPQSDDAVSSAAEDDAEADEEPGSEGSAEPSGDEGESMEGQPSPAIVKQAAAVPAPAEKLAEPESKEDEPKSATAIASQWNSTLPVQAAAIASSHPPGASALHLTAARAMPILPSGVQPVASRHPNARLTLPPPSLAPALTSSTLLPSQKPTAAAPFSQSSPAAAAAAPATTPTPTPAASTAASGALTMQLVDDVVSLPAGVSTSSSTSSTLLLRHLPACLTVQMIGSLFCSFGKLRVHLVLTRLHGVTAICAYTTPGPIGAQQAEKAKRDMDGRTYQMETHVPNDDGTDSVEYEQWTLDDIVYAQTPLRTVPLAAARIKLIRNDTGEGAGSLFLRH
jgi:chemotaxis protein histidine kinase CheA